MSKVTNEISLKLRDNTNSYVVLNLKECYGDQDNIKTAQQFIQSTYPDLNYFLVTSPEVKITQVSKSKRSKQEEDPIPVLPIYKLPVVFHSSDSGTWMQDIFKRIGGLDVNIVCSNITDMFVTLNTEYPDKLADQLVGQVFTYLREKHMIPDAEEPEYINPEDHGIVW